MKDFLKRNKKRLFIIFFFATLLNMIALLIFDSQLKNEVCTQGIVSYELAKSIERSTEILNSWNPQSKINAGLSLGFDFLFLLVYSSFISLLIYNINNRLWKDHSFYKFGQTLIILIFCAALFDLIENVALIKLLLGDLRQIWSSVAYYFASVKFVLILIGIFYLLINWFILLLKRPQKVV